MYGVPSPEMVRGQLEGRSRKDIYLPGAGCRVPGAGWLASSCCGWIAGRSVSSRNGKRGDVRGIGESGARRRAVTGGDLVRGDY